MRPSSRPLQHVDVGLAVVCPPSTRVWLRCRVVLRHPRLCHYCSIVRTSLPLPLTCHMHTCICTPLVLHTPRAAFPSKLGSNLYFCRKDGMAVLFTAVAFSWVRTDLTTCWDATKVTHSTEEGYQSLPSRAVRSAPYNHRCRFSFWQLSGLKKHLIPAEVKRLNRLNNSCCGEAANDMHHGPIASL